ncbi:hypothetical protein L4D76_00225 [Photobacterium sagamiensis]|uniref:RNA ligase family protein n=1 Tax=Photobacterium sagamiensis TaxID=2910241 RepID=UPI003D12286C
MAILLSRDDFREAVFARDKHTCVFCDQPAQDAHHILDRRLWSDGGYYLENGASVCGKHHIMCETTEITVEDVRLACGITEVVVPEHMYPDHEYDKWGNHVLPNGQRTKGELFHNESVQKILRQSGMIELFTDYVKYPRTFHLPWSDCVHSDDRKSLWMDNFIGKRVVVTEKLDGENTSLYSDYYHARSVDSRNHPSRNRTKAIWGNIAHDIPYKWRLCCENMFAKHSIEYHNLESFLYGLSIWNEKNVCLSWDDTVEWFALFNIPSVPVLYDGIYDEETIKALYDPKKDWEGSEGYVVRLADSFAYGEFRKSVAKYVRESHVQTANHWMHGQRVEENKLK